MKLYSATALADEAAVSYKQVHYWTARGYVKPAEVIGGKASGTGNRRVYDESAVLTCRILAVLLDPTRVGPVAERVARDGTAVLPHGIRITVGGAR